MRLFSVRLLVCVMVVGALVFAAAATPAQRSAAALDRPPPVAQRPPAAAVWTRGYDNNRTGANPNESLLTPTNVVSTTFGRLYTRLVDGQVYAQPLYLPNVALPDGTIRNVLFVATAKNNVYAFDADDPAASTPLWSVNLGAPGISADREFGTRYNGGVFQDIKPYVGIISTPVIDLANNIMYVVPFIKVGPMQYQHRLVALDIQSGATLNSITVAGTVPGDGPDGNVDDTTVTFDSRQHLQRSSLTLDGSTIYMGFAGYADTNPYHGWLFGYNKTSLARTMIWATTPQAEPSSPDEGEGGIWMGGAGVSADGAGNVYMSLANGSWNATTNGGRNYGSSILKLNVSNPISPTVATWFTPYDYNNLNVNDTDLGTVGAVLIPGTNVLMTGSKAGKIYVLNRNDMGGLGTQAGTSGLDAAIPGKMYQSFRPQTGGGKSIHGSPIIWTGGANVGTRMYVWPKDSPLKAFGFNPTTSTFTTTAVATGSPSTAVWPGGLISLSANGQNDGIVWSVNATLTQNNVDFKPGIVRAYNATTLQQLWASNQNTARDGMGLYAKFNPPMVADGKVHVAEFSMTSAITQPDKVHVYGLLAPRITRQPLDQTVAAGSNTTVYAIATGAGPLSYQWYRGASGDTSQPVSGATSSTLSVLNVTTTAQYWVRVSNSAGSADSTAATITPAATPIPTSIPTNTATNTATTIPTNAATTIPTNTAITATVTVPMITATATNGTPSPTFNFCLFLPLIRR